MKMDAGKNTKLQCPRCKQWVRDTVDHPLEACPNGNNGTDCFFMADSPVNKSPLVGDWQLKPRIEKRRVKRPDVKRIKPTLPLHKRISRAVRPILKASAPILRRVIPNRGWMGLIKNVVLPVPDKKIHQSTNNMVVVFGLLVLASVLVAILFS